MSQQINDPYQLNNIIFEIDEEDPTKLVDIPVQNEIKGDVVSNMISHYSFLLNPNVVN